MSFFAPDTRYNPAPTVRRVPLCPSFDTVIPETAATASILLEPVEVMGSVSSQAASASTLSGQLAATFRPGAPVHLVDSGTTALWLAFDAFVNIGKRTVALPSFGCPAFVRAARRAGMRVRLCDCERGRLIPGPDEFRRAIDEGIDVAVVADTLGQQPGDAVFDVLDEHRVPIVRDVAQSYAPSMPPLRGDVVVLSFGRHKPLPIGGGGALVVLKPDALESRLASRCSKLSNATEDRGRPWFTDVAIATRWTASQPLAPSAMSADVAHRLSAALPFFADVYALGISVHDRLAAILGVSEHLCPVRRDHGTPSCFLVARCDPRRRHALATIFADLGVETSWMYYPLHRLARQEGAAFAETEAVWPTVLCMPARGELSAGQVEVMSSVLSELA